MATVKECYTLIGHYEKAFKKKYGQDPGVNNYAARWGFDALLRTLSVDDGKGLIDYYFLTSSPNKHNLEWFFRNYEKLMASREQHVLDSERRERLRAESAQRAAEWRQRLDNQRSTSN